VKSQILSPDDYNVIMKHAVHMNKQKIFHINMQFLLTQLIINTITAIVELSHLIMHA